MTLNERFRKLGLSARQTEVALEILSGSSNQEIADRLFVAEKTIKFHLTAIYPKTFTRQRAEFIAKFLPQKLQEDYFLENAKLKKRIEELERQLDERLPRGRA